MNPNAWYRIVAYRDFHDLPHYVLATNATEDAFWILDAGLTTPATRTHRSTRFMTRAAL